MIKMKPKRLRALLKSDQLENVKTVEIPYLLTHSDATFFTLSSQFLNYSTH